MIFLPAFNLSMLHKNRKKKSACKCTHNIQPRSTIPIHSNDVFIIWKRLLSFFANICGFHVAEIAIANRDLSLLLIPHYSSYVQLLMMLHNIHTAYQNVCLCVCVCVCGERLKKILNWVDWVNKSDGKEHCKKTKLTDDRNAWIEDWKKRKEKKSFGCGRSWKAISGKYVH